MHSRVIFVFLNKNSGFRVLKNKKQNEFIDETVNNSERLMKLLHLGYAFYSSVLEKLNKFIAIYL